jgi:hypothetical protein
MTISEDMVERAIKAFDRAARDHIKTPEGVRAAMRIAITAALQGFPEWQDISTAPKDGTEILAYSVAGGTGTMLVRHIALCDFLTDSEIERLSTEGMSNEDLETPDWFHSDFLQGGRLSPDCYPTHWQQLPTPSDTRQDGGTAT